MANHRRLSARVSYIGNTTAFQAVAGGSIPPTRSSLRSLAEATPGFADIIKFMVDPNAIHNRLINLLDTNQVEYKLFSHPVALTYEDLAAVQKATGFFGTEAKCMVLKANDKFIVYVTLQGSRINFDVVKQEFGGAKVRLATAEELVEYFGAQPGCAYPFAFDSQYDIYVDPKIYKQEWLLFSPVLPTETIQARGQDLKRVFDSLANKVYEIVNLNQ